MTLRGKCNTEQDVTTKQIKIKMFRALRAIDVNMIAETVMSCVCNVTILELGSTVAAILRRHLYKRNVHCSDEILILKSTYGELRHSEKEAQSGVCREMAKFKTCVKNPAI
jgi:hypothetical protein